MREIKFRAKGEVNAVWVYGNYLYDEEKDKHIIKPIINASVYCNLDTVGQYTGLKDKNGKEIYEGDIIKIVTIDTKRTIYAQVKFGKYRDVNNDDSELGFYIESNGESVSIFNGEKEGYYLPNMVEVAGNIYDNPELIEE